MSNVYRFDPEVNDHEQLVVEASEWIAKMDKGLSKTDAETLMAWIRKDSRNEAELLKMARMWDKMDSLARLSEVFPHASATVTPPARPLGRRLAMAASFVVVITGFVITLLIMNEADDKALPELASDTTAYETAVGGISTIELVDGSVITLNTDSRAIVRFSGQQRIVHLGRGEMHIDVAHDPERPLSIVAAGRIIQAVGTSFSVRIDESQRVEVLVSDGRVRVGVREPGTADTDQRGRLRELTNHSFLVARAERVVLNSGRESVEALEPEEIEVHLSWRNGNLIFRGESLGTAVAEVGRYAPVEFVIEDEDLQQVRVAGLFKVGDVSGFLSSLEANFDIVYERADDETILLSAEKGRVTDASN